MPAAVRRKSAKHPIKHPIKREPLPTVKTLRPMEAKLAAELPKDGAWQFEPKWDGFRCWFPPSLVSAIFFLVTEAIFDRSPLLSPNWLAPIVNATIFGVLAFRPHCNPACLSAFRPRRRLLAQLRRSIAATRTDDWLDRMQFSLVPTKR